MTKVKTYPKQALRLLTTDRYAGSIKSYLFPHQLVRLANSARCLAQLKRSFKNLVGTSTKQTSDKLQNAQDINRSTAFISPSFPRESGNVEHERSGIPYCISLYQLITFENYEY